ncbi:TssN family type VI secretion system protein [Aureivirga marina]|uniref:TssN family type VI secretion system protein n=1 Tax=Aureivirga marina TaxID=1182451 RepID=UPI0018C96694|nr:TssN family type VI secretion system protein [Aureivirga marina]
MAILIKFFLQFLLVPIISALAIIILGNIAKGRALLKKKRLIVFILVLAIILTLPSLYGLLKYEFVWGGLLVTVLTYLLLGYCFNLYSKTQLFQSIGFENNKTFIFSSLSVSILIGGWLYYLSFSYLSQLSYSIWGVFTLFWFLVPPIFSVSRQRYIDIPTPFYKQWIVDLKTNDEEFWNHVDTFKLMQVNVKIKRSEKDNEYASFSVKLPEKVGLGVWFNRFVEDQNIRFPGEPIELKNESQTYGWIFYTTKWLPIPLFTKMLDFDGDVKENEISNKSTIYIRRVLTDNSSY